MTGGKDQILVASGTGDFLSAWPSQRVTVCASVMNSGSRLQTHDQVPIGDYCDVITRIGPGPAPVAERRLWPALGQRPEVAGQALIRFARARSQISIYRAANPGIAARIQQLGYMAHEVNRVRGAPADEPSFRTFDLYQNLDPSREMICSPDDLRACFADDPSLRSGPAVFGIRFRGGDQLDGRVRDMAGDGTCGDLAGARRRCRPWQSASGAMPARGELVTHPGRMVHPDAFLADLQNDLAGVHVAAAADSYKDSEGRDFLDRAHVRWPIDFRCAGAGKDGGADGRAFQRFVMQGRFAMAENLSLATAIARSTLRRDANGNPGLDRAKANLRIDVLSAAEIAAGLAESAFDRPARRRLRYTLAG